MRLEVAHNAIAGRLDIALEHLGGIASHNAARGDVLRDDAARRDDAVVSHSHSGQDDRACAKEAVGADEGADVLAFHKVVGEDVHTGRDDGVVANVDALGVGVVEIGLARDAHALADRHAPNAPQPRAGEALAGDVELGAEFREHCVLVIPNRPLSRSAACRTNRRRTCQCALRHARGNAPLW